MIDKIKNGICPFTGRRYDCGRCEVYKGLKQPQGGHTAHICLDFDDAIRDGKRGLKWLQRAVGKQHPLSEVEEYFSTLYQLGATTHPIGECDRFCFRRGCMGHPHEESK